MEPNKNITFRYPQNLIFGPYCLQQFAADFIKLGYKRLYIISVDSVTAHLQSVIDTLEQNGIKILTNYKLNHEPTISDLRIFLDEAKSFSPDSIAGIGGGSIMDLAKLIAALVNSEQTIEEIIGNGLLKRRNTMLVCMPTTSGTGSEVSPNAIILDEKDNAKKGIISPYLVPDYAYIDPVLTLSVPSFVSAFTGMDALTHCIEAYTNKHAHLMTDTLALDGIKLIGQNLKNVYLNGMDLNSRNNVALGSVYGGMCLGPVNTAAVHALAYPLGSEYKIPHGLSNAVLLPYIMEYNLSASEKKTAEIAIALGAKKGASDYETASNGINFIRSLLIDCKIPTHISELGIPKEDIPRIAKSALNVQRLLVNNPREIFYDDAVNIYNIAY